MSSFRRRGHWRSTAYGQVWVSEHWVDRDIWPSGWSTYNRAHTNRGAGTRVDRGPNALCPVCDAPVYFVRPANGGSIWLDAMGPPWPKHPCMDESRWSAPAAVNRLRTPMPATPVPAGWESSAGEVEATWDEKWGCWAFVVGSRQIAAVMRPPDPLTPIYLRMKTRRPYGIVQYLAFVDDEAQMIELVVTSYAAMKAALSGRKPAPTDDDWEMLVSWLEGDGGRLRADVERATRLLRLAVEPHLQPGWATNAKSIGGVKMALDKVQNEFGWLKSKLHYKWVRLFLAH